MSEQITAANANKLPAPKGYMCAAQCGHGLAVHREHGCDVGSCDCPAPYGRILPSPEANDRADRTLHIRFVGGWCDNCRIAAATKVCPDCRQPMRPAEITVDPTDA